MLYIKFYLGMDNSNDAVLIKQGCCLSEIINFAVWHALAAIFNDCIIKTISSDVESCEEQDGGKYLFVGQTTAELQAIL